MAFAGPNLNRCVVREPRGEPFSLRKSRERSMQLRRARRVNLLWLLRGPVTNWSIRLSTRARVMGYCLCELVRASRTSALGQQQT